LFAKTSLKAKAKKKQRETREKGASATDLGPVKFASGCFKKQLREITRYPVMQFAFGAENAYAITLAKATWRNTPRDFVAYVS
jgi:hypothetical protein